MKIIAGLGFDGRLPNEVQEQLGELVVGPAGLLSELEFRAGLVPPAQSHAERVVRYRRALESCSGESFFRKSLTADPVATAETLLAWRDYALDHGWKGIPGTASPGRLAVLAEVERDVQGLSPSLSERIAALIPRLGLIAQAVEHIVLLDPVSDWPVAWAPLFAAVAESGVEVRVAMPERNAGAPADTDLGRLQRALLDPDRATGALSLTDDGTLGLFRCIDTQAGARALVAGLSQLDNHLLIAGTDAFVLGAAARAEGLPNPGLGARSLWRPAAQMLTLVMQISLSPPSADVVLQYLTLPVGPFLRLRRDLAQVFIDQPGYDPAAWQACIDAEAQRRRERDTRFDEDVLCERIQAWLPVGRSEHSSRLSLETAIALSDQVRDYWRARYGASLDAESAGAREMLAAFEGADGMSSALRNWGGEYIDIEHLQRLLDLAAEASAIPLTQVRQVGSVSCVESPEAARLMKRPPAHVLWWEPILEDIPGSPPFDSNELAALPDAPDAQVREQLARASFERALWPVISATDSAALATIETSPDLLRLHLERLLPPSLWRGFEAALIDGHEFEDAVLPNTEPLAELPLPTGTRWWNLDRRLACPRQRESYHGKSVLARQRLEGRRAVA